MTPGAADHAAQPRDTPPADVPSVVGGVLLERGRVLLGHRHPQRRWFPGVWDLPGGHVESGESERAAVVRELQEEIGVGVAEADLDEVTRMRLPDDGGRSGGLMTVFRVRRWDREPTNCCPEEHDDLRWFDVDELVRLDLPDPAYLPLLQRLLAEATNGARPGSAPPATTTDRPASVSAAAMPRGTTAAVDPSAERRFVLTLSCPDTTGIVARIAGFLADAGGWIVEAGYHSDPDTGWFFTRQVVRAGSLPFGVDELRARFAPVAAELGGETNWNVSDTGTLKRAVLLVSKEPHCLHDLLGRVSAGELPVRLEAVIGNHETLAGIVSAHGVPFHDIPFPALDDPRREAAKVEAFEKIRALVADHEPDAIVLARFMQILPAHLCEEWAGRAINIHHSFLPSFVGARPYHQAHARGVKLIGATCHYVTSYLDAGPIIEQDVIRVDHGDSVGDMVRRGRDIERLVLARGLRWHLEDRVLVHGNKTVVFH